MNYGIDNSLNFNVVFKFRPISLKEEVVQPVSKIQYNNQEKIIKRNITMMNSKYYNGSIIPLSRNLNLYGAKLNLVLSTFFILKFDLDSKGSFFFKDDFVI